MRIHTLLSVLMALASMAATAQGIPCALCPWELMGRQPTGLTHAQVTEITQAAIAKDQEQVRETALAKYGMVAQRSMLDVTAPGCLVRGPDGKSLSFAGKTGAAILIQKGTTFSASCLVEVQE